MLNQLLSQARLERLIEFGALDPSTYTIHDLMSDVRAGVWDELDDGSVQVNTFRRNVQRAFL